MKKLHLDVIDQKRIEYEAERLKQLSEGNPGRGLLRTALQKERADNWWTAFGFVDHLRGITQVQWEEVLETVGPFKVDRTSSLSGHIGTLYDVRDGPKGVGPLAVKVYNLRQFEAAYRISDIKRHMKILEQLNHPNIIRFFGSFEVIKTQKLYILQQKALISVCGVVSSSGPVSEVLAQKWAKQVATALSYLHFLGIAHRKLNSKNILLNSSKGDAKISVPDAFAEIGDSNKGCSNYAKAKGVGHLDAFHAPETVFGTSYDAIGADIWSYGCCVFFMLTGRPPFDNWKNRDKMKEQLDTKSWAMAGKIDNGPRLSSGAKSFLSKILHGTIEKRANTPEILTHQWLQD